MKKWVLSLDCGWFMSTKIGCFAESIT